MKIRETNETTIYPIEANKDFGFITVDHIDGEFSMINCDIETIDQAKVVVEALQKAIQIAEEQSKA